MSCKSFIPCTDHYCLIKILDIKELLDIKGLHFMFNNEF